jgi:hypothetical protein
MTVARLLTGRLPVLLVLLLTAAVGNAQEPSPTQLPPTPTRPAPEEERPPAPAEPLDQQPEDAQEPAPADEPDALAGRRGPAITARVSGLAGFQSFTATDSFKAVLDTSSGPVFGGGAGLLFGRNVFVDVMVTRFSADGTRVLVTDGGEIFDLGIDTGVTVTPIDVSVGWRFAGTPRLGPTGRPRFRAVPFAGGGFGVQQYEETSEFAESGDDVSDTHGSYHVLGGVELPFTRHLGVTADVLYRWVPDAIGQAGVSAVYDETDLGGTQVRFRFTYTF